MEINHCQIPSGAMGAASGLLISKPSFGDLQAEHLLITTASLTGDYGNEPGNPCKLITAHNQSQERPFRILEEVRVAGTPGTPDLRVFKIQLS